MLTRSHLDSEMTVWFTTGLSIVAWVRPVLQFCLPVALICTVLSLVISPWSQDQSAEFIRLLEADHLDHWLENPRTFLTGTKMSFPGLPDATDRRDVIAFLKVETGYTPPVGQGPAAPSSS